MWICVKKNVYLFGFFFSRTIVVVKSLLIVIAAAKEKLKTTFMRCTSVNGSTAFLALSIRTSISFYFHTYFLRDVQKWLISELILIAISESLLESWIQCKPYVRFCMKKPANSHRLFYRRWRITQICLRNFTSYASSNRHDSAHIYSLPSMCCCCLPVKHTETYRHRHEAIDARYLPSKYSVVNSVTCIRYIFHFISMKRSFRSACTCVFLTRCLAPSLILSLRAMFFFSNWRTSKQAGKPSTIMMNKKEKDTNTKSNERTKWKENHFTFLVLRTECNREY